MTPELRWTTVAKLDVRTQPYPALLAAYHAALRTYGRLKAHTRGDHFIVLRAQVALRGRGRVAA